MNKFAWETQNYTHILKDIQCLEKVFIPLELSHIFSCYTHKLKCILLGFYVLHQHKVAGNCEAKRKLYMLFKFFYK